MRRSAWKTSIDIELDFDVLPLLTPLKEATDCGEGAEEYDEIECSSFVPETDLSKGNYRAPQDNEGSDSAMMPHNIIQNDHRIVACCILGRKRTRREAFITSADCFQGHKAVKRARSDQNRNKCTTDAS